MSFYTEDDLRRALRNEAAAATGPSPEVAVAGVRIGVLRHRRRRIVAAGLALVLVAGAAVSVAVTQRSGLPQASDIMPVSYQQACAAEPNVCRPGVTGALPGSLTGPLNLAHVPAGTTCPVSAGTNYAGPYVSGQRYGTAPVWMVLGDVGNPRLGVSVLGVTGQPGWLAAEDVLLVDRTYQGPFTTRGIRLDGPGAAYLGGNRAAVFVEPPFPATRTRTTATAPRPPASGSRHPVASASRSMAWTSPRPSWST